MEEKKDQQGASVAWFKLADLIARKEREKALNIYRLLSHSFKDRAYALQVEGDILWALDDQLAPERYAQAAFLYKKEQRWVNAIAICQHLLDSNPLDEKVLATLFDLYATIDWFDPLKERLDSLIKSAHDGSFDHNKLFTCLTELVDHADLTDDKGRKKKIMELLSTYNERLPGVLGVRLDEYKARKSL